MGRNATKKSSAMRRIRDGALMAAVVMSVALGAGAVLKAQQARQAQKATAPATIKQLFEEDQNDRRGAMSMTPEQWKKIGERDTERRREAHKMLDAGALKTGEDFEDASVIFQHGDVPQDYLLAHILAMAAMEKGDAQARWIAAATLDRYLQAVKQPQVFGTQYKWTQMKPKPQGATQEPYDKTAVSDVLRREFCVATQAGQQKNVAAMAVGKDFPSPDGCSNASDK
jgi:methionine-rich copper-binding protein CopC